MRPPQGERFVHCSMEYFPLTLRTLSARHRCVGPMNVELIWEPAVLGDTQRGRTLLGALVPVPENCSGAQQVCSVVRPARASCAAVRTSRLVGLANVERLRACPRPQFDPEE